MQGCWEVHGRLRYLCAYVCVCYVCVFVCLCARMCVCYVRVCRAVGKLKKAALLVYVRMCICMYVGLLGISKGRVTCVCMYKVCMYVS